MRCLIIFLISQQNYKLIYILYLLVYKSNSCITLVKIFVGSLKILEDLHEDPSADL